MHELSIALSIVDIAEEEAARPGGGRVVAVHLKLGSFSGVVKAALQSAFELAREGSSLPDCELIIEEIPVVVYCAGCDAERSLPSMQELRCPVCDAPTPQVVRGRDLEVVALEIDT